MGWIIIWLVACGLVAYVASQRGRSVGGFFLLSLVLSPLIGLLVLIALPAHSPEPAGSGFVLCHGCHRPRKASSLLCRHCGAGKPDPHAGQKKCPACAEWILAEAKKCKHCGEMQPTAESAEERSYPAMSWKKADEIERSLDQRRR